MSETSGRGASIGAEIRTLLPDSAPRDWTLSDTSAVPDRAPVSFAIQVGLSLQGRKAIWNASILCVPGTYCQRGSTETLGIILGPRYMCQSTTLHVRAEPSSLFRLPWPCQSRVLKEVLEDLEWPGGSIRLSLSPSPHQQVSFLAQGHGELQVGGGGSGTSEVHSRRL